MHHLSNKLLIETYEKAKELQLSDLFLQLINDEMKRRSLTQEEMVRIKNSLNKGNYC